MIPRRPGSQKTYRYFNPNFYPEQVEQLLHAAEDRWTLMLTCGVSVGQQIQTDTTMFAEELVRHIAVAPRNIPMDLSFLAILQSGTWLALLHGFLVSLKSLLDLTGSVWAMIAEPDTSSRGFHKGKVADLVLAGGKLVNWFRSACPKEFPARSGAADTIERHSREWITEAVKYRDTLMHYGDIAGLTPMSVRLELGEESGASPSGRFRQTYSRDEVLCPAMPDGTRVDEYCRLITAKADRFLMEMVRLFSYKESRVTPGPPGPGDRMYIGERLLQKDKPG
jgi:hypothetical protein